MLYKYTTNFSFLFLIFSFKNNPSKRKVKNEKIKNKRTNKKIPTKVATNSPMKCELRLVAKEKKQASNEILKLVFKMN